MDHPEGAGSQRADWVDFDPRVRLEFRGAQLSSDGGLLVMRELDDALGLSDLAAKSLRDTRRGKNTIHQLDGLFRFNLTQIIVHDLLGLKNLNLS
jgi:hypothetical protein